MTAKRLLGLLLAPAALLLGGCHQLVLLHPEGDVARQQSDIMITTTIIIALIIVPVLIAIAVIAWRYRASNKKAKFEPEWDHSPKLELLVWAAPLLIVIAVGAISWIGTHKTDPYMKLDPASSGKTADGAVEPLKVDVVSLRWKWLFFYPQYGIATVNELAAPVNRPIEFKLTADAMMNSFFIPTLAGQIYTMPGMQTQLHAVIDKPGKYWGLSANFSGDGFTDMNFWFYGMKKKDFAKWVAKVRAKGSHLNVAAYEQLRQPERDAPVSYYAHFTPHLFTRILQRCVIPGQVCMSQHQAHDAGTESGEPGHSGDAMSFDASQSAAAPAAAAH